MAEARKLICIGCPLGCPVSVQLEGKEVVSIEGYTCKRGEAYARKEVTNPTRIVTSTVRVAGEKGMMLPVKTASDIPKEQIYDCVRALKDLEVRRPVHTGDVVLSDVVGTGVDIVATRNL